MKKVAPIAIMPVMIDIKASSIGCHEKPLIMSDWKACAMYVKGLYFATCCTQLGSRPRGKTAAERNSNGKVVSNPTESVVCELFVLSATKSETPDQTNPKAADMKRIKSAPGMPEAMFTPNASPINRMMITCTMVVMASLKSFPNSFEILLMGATLPLFSRIVYKK